MGCGPTDCAGFVLHEGALTLCSEGRYLNHGDVHMGGKGGRGKWYPCSLLFFFLFRMLKRRSLYSNCQREGKKEKKRMTKPGRLSLYSW